MIVCIKRLGILLDSYGGVFLQAMLCYQKISAVSLLMRECCADGCNSL